MSCQMGTAHKIVGRIVNEATAKGMAEEDITSRFIDDIALELGFDVLNLSDDLIQKALNPAENGKPEIEVDAEGNPAILRMPNSRQYANRV